MSRIDELKKQNPQYVVDTIGIINSLFEKTKYTELSLNLIKNSNRINDEHARGIINEMVNEYGFEREMFEGKTNEEVDTLFKVVHNYFGYNNFSTIKKFIKYNERNLISQNDLSKFKTFEDLQNQISLAELKMLDKDMEKQTIKLFENNEWLVIKPMSFLASKKYGANTKWCTTQENNPDYYLRYSRRGILIYCINRITGIKVAAFKNLDTSYEKEVSFWNVIDNRIDSLESDLPSEVLEVIKHEFTNQKISNWELLSDEERNKQLMWIENEFYDKKSYENEAILQPQPEPPLLIHEEPINEEQVVNTVMAPRRARLIRMRPPHEASQDEGPMQAG
jgi:hypothetical protein